MSEARAIAITAHLLAQGRALHATSVGLSMAATVVLLVSLWASHDSASLERLAVGAATLVVVLGLVETWLAVCVGFDAQLLHALAGDAASGSLDLPAFDRSMGALGLMPPAKAGRPLAPRLAGARRLLVLQESALAAQAAVVIGGAVLAMVRW
jgi:hypothetical protein